MTRFLFAFLAAFLLIARSATAQDAAYIQIEAQPSLARAQDRVRDYASTLQDVNGFALGAGWYGIALGPYTESQAGQLLRQLRAQGRIPRDSYVSDGTEFRGQFYPVGANLDTPAAPQPVPDTTAAQPAPQPQDTPATTAQVDPAPAPEPVPEPEPAVVDETPREARASEALLNRDERKELQVALQWAGVYTAGIDGAFGRGTRRAMSTWQEANGFEATGILTTLQRAELFRQYNAVFDGMDMRVVTENRAGIAMEMPMGVLRFGKYESPFVHYDASTDLGARVLLISQPGDRNTLFGLYEIMQTLEIVPLEGPRERSNRGFTLTGANDRIVSHTEVTLADGALKGFTLIWPAGDEERRSRILGRMQASFTPIDGVLDPGAISDAGQTVDLVSGLRVRTPRVARSGFFVDAAGTVVTTIEAVDGCTRITLDDTYEAQVVAQDAATGVAVLRPQSPLAPIGVARLQTGTPRLQSEIAVSGFSYGGALSAPTLTFGALSDLKGLNGEDSMKRLAVEALPNDAGGPVLDQGGAVVGMLLPKPDGARRLPPEVSFSANAQVIQAALSQAGVSAQSVNGGPAIAPEDLTDVAIEMTVLVSCWD